MNKIKILIADDEKQLIVTGIKTLITNMEDCEVIGHASNGQQAIELAHSLSPDIVLMDIEMPVMNGIEATEKLKEDHPEIKILALSNHDQRGIIISMLEAGADGYILKDSDVEEFEQAIHAIVNGEGYFSSNVTKSLAKMKSLSSNEAPHDLEKLSLLTKREREVVKLTAEGFTSKEIGDQLHIDHKTVNTHKANIREKLNIRNTADFVRFAIRSGLVS